MSACIYEQIARWQFSRDTGASSQAIAARAIGMKSERWGWSYPYDVYDFGRCYRMLKACPSVDITVMKDASPTWERLVAAWPGLTALYEAMPQEDYNAFKEPMHAIIYHVNA